ncbi:MAG: DNA-formamidopyrimidine glycosylase family protein [Actinomycetota bacterium]
MPELPELQALAEGLDAALRGVEVTGVAAWLPSAVKTAEPPLDALVGGRVTRVWRRGKLVIVDVDDLSLVVHLMQAGRLGVYPAAARRPARTAVLSLRVGADEELRLRELSTEHRATVHLVPRGDLGAHGPLAGLGPEPVGLSADGWRGVLDGPAARLHSALRDGHRVAGIGRCYASEIMWAARLAPFATASALGDEELGRLARAADAVLTQAVDRARERITTRLPDREQRVTAVHGHAGEPCLRCGARLARVSFTGYELVYCPPCQTGGRVYADRRTSRFLR